MKKQILFFNSFALVLLSVTTAWTMETGFDQGISLDQALQIAFAKNPKMMEARKDMSASKGRWIQSEGLPDPQLGLSVGGFKRDERDRRRVEQTARAVP